MRIGIVAAEFNFDITTMMVELAKDHAAFLGVELGPIAKAPGVYDIPLLASALAKRPDVDAVVALGAVIEGCTDHDELVISQAARKLADLSVETGKPVGLGLTGPGQTRLQAHDRIGRAKDAVEAVVKVHRQLSALRGR